MIHMLKFAATKSKNIRKITSSYFVFSLSFWAPHCWFPMLKSEKQRKRQLLKFIKVKHFRDFQADTFEVKIIRFNKATPYFL